MAMTAIKQPQEPVRDQATQTEIQATQTDTQATQPQETKATTEKPDLYDHILHLIEHLAPDERLHLINDLVKSVYPIVSEYTAQLDYEDDSEDEQIIAEATYILENTPDDAWITLEEFEAELDRAEAAGELPD
jgi:hypothetical protein